ncbi:MAG TPA: DUF4331 domain-containing protein [Candidatus Limnocylindria bacterium]|nr:DUF4331 domain-containing protein [Candidatus Limnocylindria bacterium]
MKHHHHLSPPALLAGTFLAFTALASSHREAPLITSTPKVDGADFYAFGSYEPGRDGYVTFVADYLPLQDAYGGPNYFQLDPNALYEIHVDNSGDGVEDLTFQFRFASASKDISLVIGSGDSKQTNAIPLLAAGAVTAGDTSALNVEQSYTLSIIKGARRTGTTTPVLNPKDGTTKFIKPQDNVGNKTFPAYDAYADSYIYEIALPGTDKKGKVFVGQRKDPFVVNLGETFDLVNLNPLGPVDGAKDTLADKNVTALCLEIPKEFLLADGNGPVIGAWTTASTVVKGAAGAADTITQASRLGMPLVNELVIGLKDKDAFNASEPKNDGQFAAYVTHPTLPALLELLFKVPAPTAFPRNDLLATFVTGVDGLNKFGFGEMQRLNTAIAATPLAQQNNLGVIAGFDKGVLTAAKADLAGYPNGRRPGDDVVDISLRVVMGKLLTPDVAPVGDAPLTDGANVDASMFLNRFPYLTTPIPGSPNDPTITITAQTAGSAAGPYKAVKGSYDPATRKLTVPATGDAQFLRIKSDAKVGLTAPQTGGDAITATVN